MHRILIGTAAGLWAPDAAGPVAFEGRRVTALAPPIDWPWVVLDATALMRLDQRGRGTEVARGEGYSIESLSNTPAGLFVGASEARLLTLEADRLMDVPGFDEIDGRDRWFTPWGGPPDVRSIASGPDRVLHVNVHVGGDSWSFDDEGLHATYARAVAVAGDTLVLSVSRGPSGGEAAIYRRPLTKSVPFQRCREGLPTWFDDNIDTHCLAALGDTVVFGTADGIVYRSDDAGATWETLMTELPAVTCVLLGD